MWTSGRLFAGSIPSARVLQPRVPARSTAATPSPKIQLSPSRSRLVAHREEMSALDALYITHIVLEIFLGLIKLRGRCKLSPRGAKCRLLF